MTAKTSWKAGDADAAVGEERFGRTIFYSDLPGGRFHMGKYLARIAAEEARQGRPPLTAVVVAKATVRPQYGFMDAMWDVG